VTQIHALDIDARVQEIANMLSGEEMTEAAISNAKALLKV
jgi:DNA repair protein RecN (Recombination protein N)